MRSYIPTIDNYHHPQTRLIPLTHPKSHPNPSTLAYIPRQTLHPKLTKKLDQLQLYPSSVSRPSDRCPAFHDPSPTLPPHLLQLALSNLLKSSKPIPSTISSTMSIPITSPPIQGKLHHTSHAASALANVPPHKHATTTLLLDSPDFSPTQPNPTQSNPTCRV